MIISTYNVNSVNARIENLLAWLSDKKPDIVLLQEIKSEFENFPFFEIRSAGYDVKILGQKAYNGVAVLSKNKLIVRQEGLPFFEDTQARYLECLTSCRGQEVVAACVYVPNGNPPYNNPDDWSRLDYKLKFMDALYKHAEKLLDSRKNVVLGGDFNVIMSDLDVFDPRPFINNALTRESVRQRLRALQYLGFYDAFRLKNKTDPGYTYWDYGNQAFMQDLGLRIDYLFVSPSLADNLTCCNVDKSPRGAAKPSDHTALTAEFDI